MSAWVLIGIFGAALLGTVTQQVTGFGFALMSIPLLSLMVGPKDAVAIEFVAGLASSGLMAFRLRQRIERTILKRILIGGAFGLPLGVVGLRQLPEQPLRIGLAVVVLVAVVLIGTGYGFRTERPRTEIGAGFVSGVLNGSIGIGGPPVVVVLQAARLEQHAFRATTTAFFVVSGVVGLPLIALSGAASSEAWWASPATIPAVLIGTWAGELIAFRVDPRRFKHLVLGLLVVAALSALASALS